MMKTKTLFLILALWMSFLVVSIVAGKLIYKNRRKIKKT